MSPNKTASPMAPYVIDEARHSVVLKRELAASVEEAFAFWTQPSHITQWWDPTGLPLQECHVDLRVGGELRFVNTGHHGPPFIGHYLEIKPFTRLVFEAMGATGTVTIRPMGKGSEVEVEIRAPNAEALKMLLGVGLATGTAQTLDNLKAHASNQH